ncbi:hypothetical protein T440DRAFT_466937 [Plenodomus tracheiphilus IPT5]|uniref:Uncharacterized protein n=1 Tax=Plenodomus tracheiphilus IPT5 TaxID=1408161 RepID=A0A6A7BDK5_9PLEO|nr:hypothetical protein T440DRAFT_466937 [Plenodomus tracheiphilus IPT5]
MSDPETHPPQPLPGANNAATIIISGDGSTPPTATWSMELSIHKSELPGYIVDTMFTSNVRYIRVTVSEARSWAQVGARIYSGGTLLIVVHDEVPEGPMVKPEFPGEMRVKIERVRWMETGMK